MGGTNGRSPKKKKNSLIKRGSFPFCPPPPQLSGCILCAPPQTHVPYLNNDSICTDTCSVTARVAHTERHKRKRS